MRGFESTKEVNPYALERVKQRNRREMESIKQANKKSEEDVIANDPLTRASNAYIRDYGDPHAIDLKTNEEGTEVSQDYNFSNYNAKNYGKDIAVNDDGQIGLALDVITSLNPNGDVVNGVETNQWTINVDGKNVTGSEEVLRYALSDRDAEGNLTHKEDINRIFKENYNLITNVEEDGTLSIRKSYPNLKDSDINRLIPNMNKSVYDRSVDNLLYETSLKSNKKTYAKTEGSANSSDSDIAGLHAAGMLSILDEDGSLLSSEEYENKILEAVSQGKITNYDQWGIDAGTSNKDYYHDEDIVIPGSGYQVKTSDGYVTKYKYKSEHVIDQSAVRSEARDYYNAQYTAFNESLLKHPDSKGSYTSLKANNIDGTGDLTSNAIVSGHLNIKGGNNAGRQLTANLLNQVTYSSSVGDKVGYSAFSDDGRVSLTNNPLAEEIGAMFLNDISIFANQPTTANSLKGMPNATIKYANTYGDTDDPDKNTGAYIVTDYKDWLSSKEHLYSEEAWTSLYKEFKDGVKLTFLQKDDISPIAKGKGPEASYLAAQILATENNAKRFDETDSDGYAVGQSTYIRKSKYEYTVNTRFSGVDSKGNSTWEPLISEYIKIENEDFSVLDNIKMKKQIEFSNRLLENSLKRKKIEGLNKGK
jgi:hypothetical protein